MESIQWPPAPRSTHPTLMSNPKPKSIDAFQPLAFLDEKEKNRTETTKVMPVPGGVIVQVSVQQFDRLAVALVFVPGAVIAQDGDGIKLAAEVK